MEHIDIPAGERHPPQQWRVADAAARLLITPTEADTGSYCWQVDDDTEWMLVTHAPVVWSQRGAVTSGAVTAALGYTPANNATLGAHTGDTANPHAVTQAQVGLGSAENKSSATIRSEITSGNVTGALGFTPVDATLVGAADGVAQLDSGGKVPAAQLPGYVDDVLEYANEAGFPATGETGKMYVALDTDRVYRWSGSAYVEISPSPGSTDAVTEGSTNLYFTAARVLGAVLAGLSTATNAVITGADTVLSALGKLQRQISDNLTTLTSHTSSTSNPHSVTKAQVGLGSADNTADSAKSVASAGTLTTARTINGTSFNGSTNVTVAAAAGTLTGATLAAGVTASSLTSVGVLTSLVVDEPISSGVSGGADGGILLKRASDGSQVGALSVNSTFASVDFVSGYNLHRFLGSSAVERMRIDATGLGIGGTPARLLSLNGVAGAAYFQLCNTTSGVAAADGLEIVLAADGVNASIINRENGFLEFRTNNIQRLLIDAAGAVSINGDTVRIVTAKTPASATAAGVAGDICRDANYVYVCTATNTWKRVAIATW